MGRKRRDVVAGGANHIWQRGNHQEPVFTDDSENRLFLSILFGSCAQSGVSVSAYCLMTNHYHLVATGGTEGSISAAIGRANQEYSAYQNRKRGTKGRLWQERFGSKPLSAAHYWAALCYVERNPVDAGIVSQAWDWPWSSARAHLGIVLEPYLDYSLWQERYDRSTWKRALEVGIFESALEERKAIGQFLGDSHLGKVLVAQGSDGVDAACTAGWQQACR
jgi:putative transposase